MAKKIVNVSAAQFRGIVTEACKRIVKEAGGEVKIKGNFTVVKPDGEEIECHNRATAEEYQKKFAGSKIVRNR